MRRAGLAALAAGALLAVAPVPAYADGALITDIVQDGAALKFVFAAGSLPPGTTIDPASVQVTINGTAVESRAVPVVAASVSRSAVLVIDTSGSMRGEGITGAKSAGLAFVDAVPNDVKVGLVTFSDTAVTKVAPTTDRAAVRRAVNAITPTGETSLYDGVLLGLRQLGTSGSRSLLVLSDGADTRSKATLPDVVKRVKGARVTVNTVAFKTPDATARVLDQIAAAGGGHNIAAARAGDIGAAFRETARAISNQLAVTATIPQGVSGSVTIAATARAGEVTLSDESLTRLAEPPASPAPEAGPVDVDPGALGGHAALYTALVALFVGLAVVLASVLGSFSGEGSQGRVRRRLSWYTLTGRGPAPAPDPTALGDSGVARSAVELAGRMVRERGLEASLGLRLESAGSPLKPAEWVIVHASATLGAGLLMLLLFGGRLIPTLLGLFLGFLVPYAYLRIKATRRTNAFLAQIPDTLQLIAGSLSAGYSLPQAIDAVVREGSQPISTEFNRALVESRLGVPIEDALENVAHRMDSRDFAWVVMAVRIQREVGGNLGEVLTTVAATMRDRERVRRQVQVLSAEGRLSAWVLGGLPPVFALYLLLVRPNYIRPLWHDPIGLLLLGMGGLLFTVGVLWLRKVVRVEV